MILLRLLKRRYKRHKKLTFCYMLLMPVTNAFVRISKR
ncbi:Uncharacterised protein [Vibrio cholerae]|nr:Uncharacterised protein [Vibrio cholerae]